MCLLASQVKYRTRVLYLLPGIRQAGEMKLLCWKMSGVLVLVQHGFSHICREGRVLGSCTFPTATGYRAHCGSTFTHKLEKVDFDLKHNGDDIHKQVHTY